MTNVNIYFIFSFLYPLTGMGDDDEQVNYYMENKPSSEDDYRLIIRQILVPSFKDLNETEQDKAKITLKYLLNKNNVDFERIFESKLPPFELVIEPRNFFLWIWEELFNPEEYIIEDLKEYKENNNIHEPNRYKF